MSEHTPGPWERYDETVIISASCPGSVGCTFTGGGIDIQEARANARLIAAAPEMYEFIRATSKEPCEDVISVRADEYCHNCVSCDARALLAKIDGEEKP